MEKGAKEQANEVCVMKCLSKLLQNESKMALRILLSVFHHIATIEKTIYLFR